MRRVVIVGPAFGPSWRGDHQRAFMGRTGQRLADASGLTLVRFQLRFRPVNLIPRWPGNKDNGHGHGDDFPLVEASMRAAELWPTLRGKRVLMVGRNVARAFCVLHAASRPYLEWFEHDMTGTYRGMEVGGGALRVAIMPHPSGLNHWWNDPGNVERARAFMGGAAREAVGRR